MSRTRRIRARLSTRGIGALAFIAFVASSALGDTVRLRTSVRAPFDQELTLADVARLDGDRAASLGSVVVVADPSGEADTAGRVVVTIDDVRRLIGESDVSLSRVALSGGRCVVRLVGRALPGAEEDEATPEPRRAEPLAVDGPETVRRHVAELLVRMFGAAPGEIRVLFNDSDEELLAVSGVGKTIIAQPRTSGRSARVLVDVRVLSGERTIAHGTVRADVEVRRSVLIAARELNRHEPVGNGDIETVRMWTRPGGSEPVGSLASLEGQWARGRVEAGSILRGADFEPAVVVNRGELVTVLCMSGGVGIRTQARALADGRVGEVIECRTDRRSEPFSARVDGPGRVVLSLDAEAGA